MGKEEQNRFLGTFELSDGQRAFGELKLAGAETALTLRYARRLGTDEFGTTLHGELHDLSKVSCIDSVFFDEGFRTKPDVGIVYSREVFPHYVLVGERHFDPARDRITELQFNVGDLDRIFNDYDAFGSIYRPPEEILQLIPEKTGERTVPKGPAPRLVYFAGRELLADVKLQECRVEVRHQRPSEEMPSAGFSLQSQPIIHVCFDQPAAFDQSIRTVQELRWFFSIIAGRSQGINDLAVRVNSAQDRPNPFSYLRVLWPMSPRDQTGALGRKYTPDSRDTPLDPIRRPDEFAAVLQGWSSRIARWRHARARLDACLGRGNQFDVDRLVAAANLFDLLPLDAFPAMPPMSVELEVAVKGARELLRSAPNSDDRNSALNAIGRVGRPTLTKRVLHCAQIVRPRFGDRLPRLEEVVRLAVKCRNYYVHGSEDFDIDSVSGQSAFLTETLEFVFSARDLIEAGWRADLWSSRAHTSHHWYARYLADYAESAYFGPS